MLHEGIYLFNDLKTLNSLNRNTDTVLFTGDTDTVLTLVSCITLKLTSLIHKHACPIDNNKCCTKKGYYFCKYYKPLDPKGCYSLIYSLKLHLKREYNIN